MRTHHITTYTFDELSDVAKEKARIWFRDGYPDYDWWDLIYADASYIGLTITGFDIGRDHVCNGTLDGTVGDTIRQIIANHGKDCGTYKLALDYYRRRHAKNPYSEEEFTYALREEYRAILSAAYECLLSDESIDETILANGYEFLPDGRVYC